MKIAFHGAAQTVTGSKHLVTTDSGKKILLDCGFFQGMGKETDDLNRHLGFNPSEVDVLILSHAHIDHSGNIPYLVKQGFRGKIYCTPATKDLCEVMLADTAHIQESDLRYVNKRRKEKNQPLILPLYVQQDVDMAIEMMQTVPYGEKFKLNDEVEFHYTDSGHILGSAAVNLSVKSNSGTKKIFFSADIGRPNDRILIPPQPFPQADIILCESTYGNRLHKSSEDAEKKLFDIILDTCITRRGKLIIPAFSLGRTQEIVYVLNNLKNKRMLPDIMVYVDSPLSINATEIMRAHPESFNADIKAVMKTDPDPFGFGGLKYVREASESKSLNDMHEPCIIISASGMAEAGRVKHHILNNIGDPKNTIMMVGYCTPTSLGGHLAAGDKQVRIYGKDYDVKAKVEVMNSYSAHADYNEMLQYLSCQDPKAIKKMFLVHGELQVQTEWKATLMKAGYQNIEIPERHTEWEV
ncbi:MAG: MBL fold metallo-hydrolase [Bacteroidota bacterium]